MHADVQSALKTLAQHSQRSSHVSSERNESSQDVYAVKKGRPISASNEDQKHTRVPSTEFDRVYQGAGVSRTGMPSSRGSKFQAVYSHKRGSKEYDKELKARHS